jgi:hypothetical protein
METVTTAPATPRKYHPSSEAAVAAMLMEGMIQYHQQVIRIKKTAAQQRAEQPRQPHSRMK